jgi:PAS domain S-box-containing protein
MEVKLRKTSIDAVGNVPWGTHFCQFYQTKEDLIDILVPYFKAGLQNNEFCMWITSDLLNVEDTHKALKKKVRNLEDYIEQGQIEILHYKQWYDRKKYFNPEELLKDWAEKEQNALKRGFDGFRLTGDSNWLDKKDWKKFTNYEAVTNSIIAKHKMLAVCTYSLDNCSPPEIIDVVSNHQFALIKQDKKWKIIQSSEHKKAKEALKLSEERYALAQRASKIGSWDWDIETGSLHWSENIEPLFGFAQGQFGATYEAFLECVHPDDRQYVVDSADACVKDGKDYAIEHRIIWPNGTVRWVAETGDVIRNKNGKAIRMLGVVQDITKRKDQEVHRQLARQILERLNQESVGIELIADVLKLIKKTTGFDAVGIRQQENRDFPYFEVNGFPDDFVKAENHLCLYDETGELILDSEGRPILECMCGIVLSGRTDPTLPFFTKGGSFWVNSTSKLEIDKLQKKLKIPIRNRCNKAGYESVALIPLRSGEEIVGLLQLNDTRRGLFTEEMIHFLEEIGASIGIGLARIRSEQEVENLAKFPSEDPYPVLRITKDRKVLYANSAGSNLLENWGCKVGELAPEHWHKHILKILETDKSKQLEVACQNRIFSLVMTPITETGYVNVYGSDITDLKQAEENLRQYQLQLEELVQTRTAELTETNKKLLREIEGRKRLEKQILNISEREQKRIGQELHDSIGQQFTGIAFMTKVLEQKLSKKFPDQAKDATEIKKLVNQAMNQTRSLARGLHPVDLDAGSLTSALQELAATTENLFGTRCSLKYDEHVIVDDSEVATHLYRITQEAITNAIKHGQTNNIQIQLSQKKDKSVLTIENDGLDFPEEFEINNTGMGLQIMDHRADIIGAELNIHKAAKGGTILTCSFSNKKR